MKLPGFFRCLLTPSRSTGRVRTSSSVGKRRAFAAVPLILLVTAALLSACGGGGSSSKSAAATTTTAAPNGQFNPAMLQAFTKCLSDHGVAVPTTVAGQTPTTDAQPPGTNANGQPRRGGGGGGGAFRILNSSDPNTQAAIKACQNLLPAGFLQRLQQGQTARQAFVSCMKDHGVTVTGGGFGRGPGGPGGAGNGGSTTTTTPEYAAAFAACKALLPARGTFGPGGGPTTTA